MSSNLVCPRCGAPAADHRYCPNCGFSLHDQPELPTREDWERQVLAAAQEFAGELPARRRSRWKVPAAVLAVAAVVGGASVAAVLLVGSSDDSTTDSPTAGQTPPVADRRQPADDRRRGDSDLEACVEGWNSDRRILRSGYARGAGTAFVLVDSKKRCVIALPPAAARRSGFATFVQVEGGFWGSYANNPPKGRGRAATGRALAQAKAFEKRASENPNAHVRKDGTIFLASGE